MGYKDMITGKWIATRETGPSEPAKVDPTGMF
jgi:hypothetical protein